MSRLGEDVSYYGFERRDAKASSNAALGDPPVGGAGSQHSTSGARPCASRCLAHHRRPVCSTGTDSAVVDLAPVGYRLLFPCRVVRVPGSLGPASLALSMRHRLPRVPPCPLSNGLAVRSVAPDVPCLGGGMQHAHGHKLFWYAATLASACYPWAGSVLLRDALPDGTGTKPPAGAIPGAT